MFNQRKSINRITLAPWLLNAALFISLLLSNEHTRQPQHFQEFHTELTQTTGDAHENAISYQVLNEQSDIKQICHFALDSFVAIQQYFSTCINTKLKQAGMNTLSVPATGLYLNFQSALSKPDEDHFVSLRG